MKQLKYILFLFFLKGALHAQTNSLTQAQVDSLPCIILDKGAEFPGGNDSLFKFIGRNIKYPPIQRCDVEGTIYVEFIIEKDGKISNIKVKKGVNEYFDNEAKRVVKSMPNWIPGEKDNKIVRTIKYIPIRFYLR